jgi:lipoic acid synthetase
MAEGLPDWLRVKVGKARQTASMSALLSERGLHTVCRSAKCPNIGECFGRGTATFMILGNVCTRDCRFCGVATGRPLPVDEDEPRRVAQMAAELGLRHVVITSVTRDDLPDGGAGHFARTVQAVRERLPDSTIEILTPDFMGDETAIRVAADARPDVYNHNVETIARLYPTVRPQALYERSLALLGLVKQIPDGPVTKSGLMLGLGETLDEVKGTLEDLRAVGCDVVTLGQYLQPSRRHLPVRRYVPPAEFDALRATAEAMGFASVAAGPFVRSSYLADEAAHQLCDRGLRRPTA